MVPSEMALTCTPLRPSSRSSMPPTSILVARLVGDGFEVPAVIGVLQGRSDPQQLLGVDEAAAIGDLLDAGDHPALALLDGAHELGGVEDRVRRAGVEPGEAATHALAIELAESEISEIDGGDLKLAAWRRLEVCGDVEH